MNKSEATDCMYNICVQKYRRGPDEQNSWERAGGDVTASGGVFGRTGWFNAFSMYKLGGGGRNLTLKTLWAVLHEDFPNGADVHDPALMAYLFPKTGGHLTKTGRAHKQEYEQQMASNPTPQPQPLQTVDLTISVSKTYVAFSDRDLPTKKKDDELLVFVKNLKKVVKDMAKDGEYGGLLKALFQLKGVSQAKKASRLYHTFKATCDMWRGGDLDNDEFLEESADFVTGKLVPYLDKLKTETKELIELLNGLAGEKTAKEFCATLFDKLPKRRTFEEYKEASELILKELKKRAKSNETAKDIKEDFEDFVDKMERGKTLTHANLIRFMEAIKAENEIKDVVNALDDLKSY